MSDEVRPQTTTADQQSEATPAKKPRRRRRTKAEMEAARAAEAAELARRIAAGEEIKPRRKRRTKAEMEAARAAEAAERERRLAAGEDPKPRRKRRTKAEMEAARAAEAAAKAAQKAEALREAQAQIEAAGVSPEVVKTAVSQSEAQAQESSSEKPAATSETSSFERKPRRERHNNRERTESQDRSDTGDKSERSERFESNRSTPSFRDRKNTQNDSRQNRRTRNRRESLPAAPSVSREELAELSVSELRTRATEVNVAHDGMHKHDLVEAIFAAVAAAEGFRPVEGILEVGNEGYGWLRTGNYMEGDHDAFVHQTVIRAYSLRVGDRVVGTVGPARANSKYPPLQQVTTINGKSPEEMRHRPRFRDLTPVYPNVRLTMECGKESITGRAIDLVSPIGKGQRGLIVSSPKAGKTTVLKNICKSIATNNPEVHLICLLVDERPEEVTDMERSIKGDVVASTFDMPADNHTRVSELVIERAKRLVELGEDVVVVLDSITRLARAYNLAQPASGRVLSGGVDSAALYPPKKFLGAARNIENGGSLTIIASALVDTGSKMDEVIFEEFKGTGNMELKLDRELADKRIFPAIDPVSSGTRNEDLLIDAEFQPFVWGVRRILANMPTVERAANALVKGLRSTDSNKDFLIRSAKRAQANEQSV